MEWPWKPSEIWWRGIESNSMSLEMKLLADTESRMAVARTETSDKVMYI